MHLPLFFWADSRSWIHCSQTCCKHYHRSRCKPHSCLWSSFRAIYGLLRYSCGPCVWSGNYSIVFSCWPLLIQIFTNFFFTTSSVTLACDSGLSCKQDNLFQWFGSGFTWCWWSCKSTGFCKKTVGCSFSYSGQKASWTQCCWGNLLTKSLLSADSIFFIYILIPALHY